MFNAKKFFFAALWQFCLILGAMILFVVLVDVPVSLS
jgi:hypothetical protein